MQELHPYSADETEPTQAWLGRAAVFRPRPFDAQDYIASRPKSRRGRSSVGYLEEPKAYVPEPKPKPQIWAPYGVREAEPGLDKDEKESEAYHARDTDEPYAEPEPEPEPQALHDETLLDLVNSAMPWPALTDLDSFQADIGIGAVDKNKTRASTQRKPKTHPEDDLEKPRRLGRSAYDAMETHGHFGLVDGGETSSGGIRRVIVHVPKRNRGYALDIKQGEIIFANSARGKPVGGRLEVSYVSRHKYVSPGHAVSSCVVGIPEDQWRRFRE